jgi:CRP-like cAMP-binding protein
VIAKTDVECYRLDRASVQGLLLSRPNIAEHVSKVVGSRRSQLQQTREDLAAMERVADAEVSVDLLTRIRKFFGLRG